MEEYITSVRPATKSAPKAKEKRPDVVRDDGFDRPELKVPRSVLDACQESFTAADEVRTKSSVKFFDSTALMALICRHDRVLWLVNMTSAGEKQVYPLILLEILFQHLPLDWTVGGLYDVMCMLERTCRLWGFLDRYIDRMSFAVSVFHAFGHGWPCQIIYHPRKCLGFGFSDGEGCERLWQLISFLISYLRVCGVST